MPKRQYANPMPLRQYLSTTSATYDRIYGRACFHVDAWLIQAPDDTLYFVLEGRAGGQALYDRRAYRASPDGLTPVAPDVEGMTRHVDSPWARARYPWLDALHRNVIQPTLRQPREGFKGPPSVRLHYVYTHPTLCDPLAGVANLYSVTGRAERDSGRMIAPDNPPPLVPPGYDGRRWSAAERSRLRTLDKLLK